MISRRSTGVQRVSESFTYRCKFVFSKEWAEQCYSHSEHTAHEP